MILHGNITISRRLREHAVWQKPDYGWAWIDLLMLANNRECTKQINGQFIDVKRGQLLWSLRSLEIEWHKSGEFIAGFLRFCQDKNMIRVESIKNRGTIITILNYEDYNPPIADSETVTNTATEADSETVTNTEWNGEMRNENKKGERATPPKNLEKAGFSEVPSESEVLTVAEAFPGDLARGIPAHIPARWAADWFRYKFGSGQWPKKWREKLALDFRNDWLAGHPKARSGAGGAIQTAGRSPAQARFEMSRELEEIQERLDACHENDVPAAAKDKARERELLKLLKDLSK
jgi:hypothetical protein